MNAPELPAHVTWSAINRAINQLVTERDGEWCGVPLPLPSAGLVLEDRYPPALREMVDQMARIVDPPKNFTCSTTDVNEAQEPIIEVNRWRGRTKHGVSGEIILYRHGAQRFWGLEPDSVVRNQMRLGRFEAIDAWSVEAEQQAMNTLAEHATARQYKQYVLTGGFLEQSTRSGLHYWFRRLAPTVVLTSGGGRPAYFCEKQDSGMRILCALCLHPLAYYTNTLCGAMTPTDDVLAHLLLMRGDEALFWKRANQHPADSPLAGL
jgi:hypothetical protein